MPKLDKVEVYQQETERGTSYMMFIEYKGLRFAKPWVISRDATIDPADIAQLFCAQVQDEIEINWDSLESVGVPVESPLPEWVSEWERFEY